MGHHLIDGEFQSDKYPTTPRGKVPLSCKDPTAQDLLWEYAQRRRAVDAEFADDLEAALKRAGYSPDARCTDCQRHYTDGGFPDLIIPYAAWKQISPSGDDGGLLCPSCICARLHAQGIACEGAFMSGPIESVPRSVMYALRRVENIELAIEGRDNRWSGIRDLIPIGQANIVPLESMAGATVDPASDIPDDVLRSRALYRQIKPLPLRPIDDPGGAYIGLTRGKTPANEATSVFHIEDERAPGKLRAEAERKGLVGRVGGGD